MIFPPVLGRYDLSARPWALRKWFTCALRFFHPSSGITQMLHMGIHRNLFSRAGALWEWFTWALWSFHPYLGVSIFPPALGHLENGSHIGHYGFSTYPWALRSFHPSWDIMKMVHMGIRVFPPVLGRFDLSTRPGTVWKWFTWALRSVHPSTSLGVTIFPSVLEQYESGSHGHYGLSTPPPLSITIFPPVLGHYENGSHGHYGLSTRPWALRYFHPSWGSMEMVHMGITVFPPVLGRYDLSTRPAALWILKWFTWALRSLHPPLGVRIFHPSWGIMKMAHMGITITVFPPVLGRFDLSTRPGAIWKWFTWALRSFHPPLGVTIFPPVLGHYENVSHRHYGLYIRPWALRSFRPSWGIMKIVPSSRWSFDLGVLRFRSAISVC